MPDLDLAAQLVAHTEQISKPANGSLSDTRLAAARAVRHFEVGRIYEGKVAKLMDFGAFVTILPGRDGLVHISQISEERVERVADKLREGDVIRVKVLGVDREWRIRLSMRDVDAA